MRSILQMLSRVECSQAVELTRYVINRLLDVFVVGPAAVFVLYAILSWVSGGSIFHQIAEDLATVGEQFRSAPVGYVFMADRTTTAMPTETPVLPALTEDSSARAPRRIVPISEWIDVQADELASLYLTGASVGLMVMLLVRGWGVLARPFNSGGRARRGDG